MEPGVVERLAEAIRGRIGRPCAVAVDVDGTLTVERRMGSFEIDLGAVEALRRLEAAGVPVMLVTGNSAQVVAGLARYLGASGPHVAENGCVVYRRGRLWSVCRWSARAAARLVEEEMAGVLEPSWQNRCRLHDYAFVSKKGRLSRELVEEVEALLRSRGFEERVASSGYAIHVRPRDASKGAGVEAAARLAGLEPGCVAAIGDSVIDAEMRAGAGLLAAVGNADEELKKAADLVVPGSSGEAARLFLEAILHAARG